MGNARDGTDCMRPDSSRGTNAVTSTEPCKPSRLLRHRELAATRRLQALDVNGNPFDW